MHFNEMPLNDQINIFIYHVPIISHALNFTRSPRYYRFLYLSRNIWFSNKGRAALLSFMLEKLAGSIKNKLVITL